MRSAFASPDLSTAALTGRWREMTERFLQSPKGARLRERIAAEATNVYPPRPFRALELTPFESVRAVILGQDPYHTPGKACGLAFSVPDGERIAPSLRNMFKVAAGADGAGAAPRTRTDLTDWAASGVLLLNPILTVREGEPLSHAGWGWETLTRGVIEALARERSGLVFFLWGRPAAKFLPLIEPHREARRHLVLTASHPSPFSASRGEDAFLRSDCFRVANDWLAGRGEAPIDWNGRGRTEAEPSADPRRCGRNAPEQLDQPDQPTLF